MTRVNSKVLILVLTAAIVVMAAGIVATAAPTKNVVAPKPHITSISPTAAKVNTPFTLTVNGNNFGMGIVIEIRDASKAVKYTLKPSSGTQTKLTVKNVKITKKGVYAVDLKAGANYSNQMKLTIN